MPSMRSAGALWWCLTTLGKDNSFPFGRHFLLTRPRLLDKIAKDIMVCENKGIRRWDGSIGEYKNYLRKKMVTMGQV